MCILKFTVVVCFVRWYLCVLVIASLSAFYDSSIYRKLIKTISSRISNEVHLAGLCMVYVLFRCMQGLISGGMHQNGVPEPLGSKNKLSRKYMKRNLIVTKCTTTF